MNLKKVLDAIPSTDALENPTPKTPPTKKEIVVGIGTLLVASTALAGLYFLISPNPIDK
jgi:hypothetical protein